MIESTQPTPQCTICLELIPDYVRADIGKTLFKSFMENIRDPEKKRRYDELGRAFLERQAAKKGGNT